MAGITIDCHVHLTPPEVIRDVERYRRMDEYFDLLAGSPRNKFATGEDVIDEMDKTGVDRAIVFGFAFKDMGLCRKINDYVMETVAKYPERLIGFACVNPLAPQIEREIERCSSGGLSGIGELFPEGQGFDITRQEDVGRLAGICKELDWPLMLHINEPVGHYYRGKTSTTVAQACTFAEQNPKLKIIMAHWGGCLWIYELMPELKQALTDVYYDTAATPFLYRSEIYAAAMAAGVIDKVLLGSDFPLISLERYLAGLEASGLPGAEITKIRGENAARLLGIDCNSSF